MSNIRFATPPHFVSGRLQKIGVRGHELYVALHRADVVEIWRVHCLVPSSWCNIYTLRVHELYYCYFALSLADDCLYAFVLAVMVPDEDGQVLILRIDRHVVNSRAAVAYALCKESATLFDQISLESIGLGSGKSNALYIYDQSMVMGPVPFWRIQLDDREGTFSIIDNHIMELEDQGTLTSMRYPIVLDGDQRLILKMTTDNEVAVFSENSNNWVILQPNDDTDLDVSKISTRAITETYGQSWRRCGVIESPLTIFADDGHCIFKLYHNNTHSFYSFKMNEHDNTYRLRKCSCAQVERRTLIRFYLHCADGQRVVFVNKTLVNLVCIQPPKLSEISFWAFQRSVAHQDQNGLWHGGVDEDQLRQICRLNKSVKLL